MKRKKRIIMVSKESFCVSSRKMDMGMAGAGFAMLSAFLYGLNAFFATCAYEGGSNPIAFTFHSAILGSVILFIIMIKKKIPVLPKKTMVPWLLLDGVLGGSTTLLLFSAFDMISTGIATVLHFTYPVYVSVLGIWVLKKKLTREKGIALGLSLAGIVLTSDLSGQGAGLGIFLALLSGFTYAGYILVMEKSGLQKADFIWFGFYMLLIRMLVTVLYGGFAGGLRGSLTKEACLMTVVYALLACVAANALFQFGVRYVGGAAASLFSMLEPVTCVIVGVTVLGETLNSVKILGCVLILSGILIVIREENS